MASQQDANAEPSIEEILDSIRQIISDEDEGGGAAETPAAKPQDDVIELTERAPDSPPPAAAAPKPPEPPPAPEKSIQVDMKEPEQAPPPPPAAPPVQAKKPEPAPAMTPAPAAPADDVESIITRSAEAATMQAFSELAQRATIEKGGGITIEDVVRYEVRPLLRGWIDKHLPGIVERLVSKELEKISKRFEQD